MWTGIFYALTAIACAVCLTGCIVVVQNARAERESLLRRLRSCESRTQLTETSVSELTEIVQGVAQSQKMSRVRKATTHAVGSGGEPDPIREPEQWRTWMNAQLRTGQTKQ